MLIISENLYFEEDFDLTLEALFFSYLTLYCFYARQWIFGSVYCSINLFTSSLTVSVSVFTLLAMTVERHKVIWLIFSYLYLHRYLICEGHNDSIGTEKVSQDPVGWNCSHLNCGHGCVSSSCSFCNSLHKREVSFHLMSH